MKTLETLSRNELLELANLTSRWSSQKDHRFYLYQSNPVMFPFHKSKAKIRALFGGNRSGKTTAVVVEAVMRFLGEAPPSLDGVVPKHRLNPGQKIRFCMVDYPNAFEKVIYPKLLSFLPSESIKHTVKEQGRIKAFIGYNGSLLEFMQYEQDVSKFQGASRDFIIYDEEPPENIRDENLLRLIDTDGEECFSLTPVAEENSVGYMPSLWLYDKVFLKASKVYEIKDGVLTLTTNPNADKDTEVFFASIFDNKHLSEEAIKRILDKFSTVEFKTRAYGHFSFMSGRIYDGFNELKHVIKPFNWRDPENYTLFVAIDPHPRTPHAVLFMVVDKDGTLFVVDELYEDFQNINDFVMAIKTKCGSMTPEVILIDPSAMIRNPTNGSCFMFDLIDAGLEPVPLEASKDLSRGIINVKQILSENRLFVFENCARFRFEIMHYRWSNWSKNISPSKPIRQKPVDKDDHMMENLYRICLLQPVHKNLFLDELDMSVATGGVSFQRNQFTGY